LQRIDGQAQIKVVAAFKIPGEEDEYDDDDKEVTAPPQ